MARWIDADVNRARLGSRRPGTTDFFLENAEELRQKVKTELGDFVEEECSGIRGADEAERITGCAGECSLHVSEQLALEEGIAERGAVHWYERLVSAGGVDVNEAGKHFLAATGFTENHNR